MIWILVLLLLCAAPAALAQDGIPWVPQVQILDSNGDPLASGKVHTYISGTTTNQATYTDFTLGTANANPVILDSAGRANIWLDESLSYKIVVKTSADVTVYTVDNINTYFNDELFGQTVTIGTGDAEDTDITFDGASQDYYIGLDDSGDTLVIGLGLVVGTTPFLTVNVNGDITHSGTTPTYTIGDGQNEDSGFAWNNSTTDYSIMYDSGTDDLQFLVGVSIAYSVDANAVTTWTGGQIDLYEDTTAANTLTTSECGKTVLLNSATEFATTLPSPTAGCRFEFWVKSAPSGASYTIVSASSANIIIGGINELEVDTSDDGPYHASADTITFVDGVGVVGDYVILWSDGTSWYLRGQANADGGITVTQAS